MGGGLSRPKNEVLVQVQVLGFRFRSLEILGMTYGPTFLPILTRSSMSTGSVPISGWSLKKSAGQIESDGEAGIQSVHEDDVREDDVEKDISNYSM